MLKKTEININMFHLSSEHFFRGPRYLPLEKVYFFVGHPVYFRMGSYDILIFLMGSYDILILSKVESILENNVSFAELVQAYFR